MHRLTIHPLAIAVAAALCLFAMCAGATECRELGFAAQVSGEASYHKLIGMGLSFRLERETDSRGWIFELGPAEPSVGGLNAYIYAVTPPWRGRHPTMLHTGYATTAREAALPQPHAFWFLIDRADAAAARTALDDVLWPPSELRQQRAFESLGALRKGAGSLQVVAADVEDAKNSQIPASTESDLGNIRGLTVDVRLIVPAHFKAARGIRVRKVSCPNEKAWPDGPERASPPFNRAKRSW